MEENKFNIKVRITADIPIGELLEKYSTRHQMADGDYYFLPFVYKKESDWFYIELTFDQCPDAVKHTLLKILPDQK